MRRSLSYKTDVHFIGWFQCKVMQYLGQTVYTFYTFQLLNFSCSSFLQNVGYLSTLQLYAPFMNFCHFLGLYELVQVKKVSCRFTNALYKGNVRSSSQRDSDVVTWATFKLCTKSTRVRGYCLVTPTPWRSLREPHLHDLPPPSRQVSLCLSVMHAGTALASSFHTFDRSIGIRLVPSFSPLSPFVLVHPVLLAILPVIIPSTPTHRHARPWAVYIPESLCLKSQPSSTRSHSRCGLPSAYNDWLPSVPISSFVFFSIPGTLTILLKR
jgi:hypothetical protein